MKTVDEYAWIRAKQLIAAEMKEAFNDGSPIRYDAASIKAFARYIQNTE